MKEDFSYLDTVNFAATVCDKDDIVLYQNERAIRRDGDVTANAAYVWHITVSTASCLRA